MIQLAPSSRRKDSFNIVINAMAAVHFINMIIESISIAGEDDNKIWKEF